MAETEVSICNKALYLLGGKRISSLSDSTRQARLCNEFYAHVRDVVLKSFPWNFAVTRETLTETSVSDVDAWVNLTPYILRNLIKDSSDNVYRCIIAHTASTSSEPGTGASWETYWVLVSDYPTPIFDYTYSFNLPADYLRALKVYGDYEYKIEGNCLLSDTDTIYLKFIRQVTSTTEFSANFVRALSFKLAITLCLPVTDSNTRLKELEGLMTSEFPELRFVDSIAETPDNITADTWINSRS